MNFMNNFNLNFLEEQVRKFGPEQLSDKEVLYMVLTQFCTKQKALEVTECYFKDNHNFSQINNLTSNDWQRYFQMDSKTLKMRVLCELAKRCRNDSQLILGQICSSQVVAEYLKNKFKFEKQEILYTLYLDTKNQIIYEKGIFKGTLNTATVHPREIYKTAIQHSAARIIVAHNHPSGNPDPSENDKKMTVQLEKAGNIIGIELLDHLVIGHDNYFSFRENQLM